MGHEASENILQAVILFPCIFHAHSPGHLALILCYDFVYKVRELLRDRSMLKTEANAVTVLDGTQEGSYQWVCSPVLPHLFLSYRKSSCCISYVSAYIPLISSSPFLEVNSGLVSFLVS